MINFNSNKDHRQSDDKDNKTNPLATTKTNDTMKKGEARVEAIEELRKTHQSGRVGEANEGQKEE